MSFSARNSFVNEKLVKPILMERPEVIETSNLILRMPRAEWGV